MLNAKCSQDELYNIVQTVGRGVSGRSTQPVQNNIYLSSQGDSLRLVATELFSPQKNVARLLEEIERRTLSR